MPNTDIYLRANEDFSTFAGHEVTGTTDFDGSYTFTAQQQCKVVFYAVKPSASEMYITQQVESNNAPKVMYMTSADAKTNGIFGFFPAEEGDIFAITSTGGVSGIKNVVARVFPASQE